jgi:uncharacterized protein with GYD domain
MSLYMVQAAYTSQAWSAMSRKPEDREKAVRDLVERAGGKLQNTYFSFGPFDVVVIFDAPDAPTAAAIAVAANNAGHLRSIQTTPLLTVSEAMEVMRKAGTLSYNAPTG